MNLLKGRILIVPAVLLLAVAVLVLLEPAPTLASGSDEVTGFNIRTHYGTAQNVEPQYVITFFNNGNSIGEKIFYNREDFRVTLDLLRRSTAAKITFDKANKILTFQSEKPGIEER